ncbi:PAS domain S-box protein [Pseudaminobacter arsenicus]|uniref:histidine kinase n=1 Tax=Borborobacter arsenicus TaxID=1851146 RepID=A0A432VAC2_9HYPH|nr:ATP-binding protein [Pseudaminobacter arsenicus]RUM99094.1 PAS domain S-box protein [Pseudaminobacter arsenicus]
MASASYSFIDVAVLDDVRERFARGEALAILSTDLEQVIWANGPGATLLGYPHIEAIIGESPLLGSVARRQIMATSGFPNIGRDRSILVRLTIGMESRAVNFTMGEILLPDSEKAILLAAPAGRIGTFGDEEIMERAIGGLSEPGQFAAFVDAKGEIQVASAGFSQLGIATQVLADLAGEAADERDRLVKKMIKGASGQFPAGMARLTDEPALHLLVVVAERQEAANAGTDGTASQHDYWYFSSGQTDMPTPPAQDEGATTGVAVDRDAAPVRFVWRTDAHGRFSAISHEFANAVGELAADVVGRRFRDVANTFGLDPSGEISGLLERRDTWSGRSVLWPVAGTDVKIPVDLAALPVYSRSRDFEGFRGFGVARAGDAVKDPEALGLVLVAPARPAEDVPAPETAHVEAPAPDAEADETQEEAPEAADPFHGEVPALAIVPKPDRRFSDKVIRLAEHRPQAAPEKGLSSVERSAFREIGERLKKDGDAAAKALKDTQATKDRDTAAGADENAGKPTEAVLEDRDGVLPTETETAQAQDEAEENREGVLIPDRADDIMEAPGEAEGKPADLGESAQEEKPEEQQSLPTADEPQAESVEQDSATSQAAHEADEDTAPETAPARHANSNRSGAAPSPESAEDGSERPARATDTSILEKLPVPVLIHSGDVLHYANEEFLTLTAYASVAKLEAAGGLDALFAETYDEVHEAEAPHQELRMRTGDGLEFPIEALLRSVPWNGGKALMLVVRRTGDEEETAPPPAQGASEAELRARVAEMRTIIDTATDGVVLIANDGTIRSISRPAEALFGFDSDEVVGKPFTSLFAMESQRAAGDYLSGLTEHGVASVLNDGREVIGREAQGGFIPLFMTIGRLPNESGFCAVLRDITQWKRAEEDLTQARAMAERASSQKTDFLARVSHEIRTPLNAIIGFSELMVDEKFGPIANDRYRDYLRDINRSGNHVLDLVNDLLDISKIEAGQQEMAHEAVSLNDALAETVAMMQPQANRERVIIRSSFASKLPDVVADRRSIRQIALNILSNAVRYTQAGGQVIVSTAYEMSGDVVMRVRDTGVGMTQAEIEQALKPFKQINALKRARGDGTGLGLPLTKAMVEANRAKFSINSTPGEGTLVEVTFPTTRVLAD